MHVVELNEAADQRFDVRARHHNRTPVSETSRVSLVRTRTQSPARPTLAAGGSNLGAHVGHLIRLGDWPPDAVLGAARTLDLDVDDCDRFPSSFDRSPASPSQSYSPGRSDASSEFVQAGPADAPPRGRLSSP